MTEQTVSITEFDPEAGVVRGHGADGTGYVLQLVADDVDKLLSALTNTTDRCPRCDFENAMADLVYAGEFIRQHYKPDTPGQLSDSEVAIVDAGRSWLTDDAIRRCLDEPGT